MSKVIRWELKKSAWLKASAERGGIGFEECAVLIEAGQILDSIDNPSANHLDQKIFVLEINSYVYLVPYVETEEEIFLKTLYPIRKHTAIYEDMKKQPYVEGYFDDEEKSLIESMEHAINKDDYVPVSNLTEERLAAFREAAKNTLNEKTTQITLRIPHTDLVRLKGQSMREGIPYQTWIKSILHKSLSS